MKKQFKEPLKNRFSLRNFHASSENAESATKPYQMKIRRGAVKRLQPKRENCSSKDVFQRLLNPIHPGEILMEEFMQPFGISQYKLAKDIHVSPRRINEIVHGMRAISADTALRLGQYFGTSAQLWLNLQTHYDLEKASEKLSKKLKIEVKIFDMPHCIAPKYAL